MTTTNLFARTLLQEAFAGLRNDLIHDDAPRISTMRNYRFAIVPYAPTEEFKLRGEVQKLFVLTSARGLGISSLLMQAAEAAARAEGRTLLVLDTLLGSHAETVYRHLGWQRAGEIPAFAAAPDGELFPTVYYFKRLES